MTPREKREGKGARGPQCRADVREACTPSPRPHSGFLYALCVLCLSLALAGCAVTKMGATQNDQELRATLAANFPPGMSVDQVHAKLNDLGVSKKFRTLYPKTESRPEVLLVRMYYGGFWVDQGRYTLKWADASYIFGDAGLERVLLYRDHVEYFYGDPLWPPTRPAQGPLYRWPAPIPPPIDPLEGAT